MRKILVPVAILAGAVALLAALVATRPRPEPARPAERVWRVETVAAVPGPYRPLSTLYGQVEAPRRLRVRAPAGGRVAAVPVREGEPVAAGSLLVALDAADFEVRVTQAEGEVARLEAELRRLAVEHRGDRDALAGEKELLELAEAAVTRARRLLRKGLGSDEALDGARRQRAQQALALRRRQAAIDAYPARRAALEAQLERARAQLRQARLELERSRPRAPFDGIVARVPVAPGDLVRANDLLLEIYAPDALQVRALVPDPVAGDVLGALRAGVPLRATAHAAAASLPLHLDRIAGDVSPRGIEALFVFADSAAPPHSLPRAGTLLELELERPAVEAVMVPWSALYGSDRIYRVREGRLEGLTVTVAGTARDRSGERRLLVMADSIGPGDAILVTHLPNAVEGLRVEVVE